MYRRLSSPENGAEIIGGRWRGHGGSLPLPASKRFTTHDSNAFPPPPHHARGYGQRRRQERDRRRALPHLPPGWLPSRALQGAKHGAELLRHRRRSRAGPRAGGASRSRWRALPYGHESAPAQAFGRQHLAGRPARSSDGQPTRLGLLPTRRPRRIGARGACCFRPTGCALQPHRHGGCRQHL